MVRLSVNVNKVATLRKFEGRARAAAARRRAGVPLTPVFQVSPFIRAPYARTHHTQDVHDIAAALRSYPSVEFNIEGDPRPDLLTLVRTVHPHQCTLLPVAPGEITKSGRWMPRPSGRGSGGCHCRPPGPGIRVSLFVDA